MMLVIISNCACYFSIIRRNRQCAYLLPSERAN